MAIPQGYGLFIKTVFQASSSTEPSELRFWGQREYLAVSPSPHLPVVSPYLISGHPWGEWGRENFPFPTWRLNLSVVTRQLGDLYRLEQFRKEMSLFPFSLIRLLALSSQRAAAALLFFLIPARNMKILQRAKRSLAGPVLRVPFKMCLQPIMGPPCWLSPCG